MEKINLELKHLGLLLALPLIVCEWFIFLFSRIRKSDFLISEGFSDLISITKGKEGDVIKVKEAMLGKASAHLCYLGFQGAGGNPTSINTFLVLEGIMEPQEEGALIPGCGWGVFSRLSFCLPASDFVLTHMAFSLCSLGVSVFPFLLPYTHTCLLNHGRCSARCNLPQ